jgi:hypothetical protein
MHSESEPGEPDIDHTATIPAGRIVHDERGNALWKWRGDTHDDISDESSGILKYVDPADLTVEGGKPPGATDSGGGYDPYNQGKPRRK